MNNELNSEKRQRRKFMILHWTLTLIFAPVFSQLISYLWGQNPHQVVALLEVYPISLLFSVVFSIPTLLVYLLANHYFTRLKTQWITTKVVLIAISIIGVAITMTLIGGSLSMEIAYAYAISALICGTILGLIYNSNRVKNTTTYNNVQNDNTP